jgi:hypothetical protein
MSGSGIVAEVWSMNGRSLREMNALMEILNVGKEELTWLL